MRKCKGQTQREGLTHRVDLYKLVYVSRMRLAGNLTDKLQRSRGFPCKRCAISRRQQTMSRHELPLSLCAINIIWPNKSSLSVKTIQSLIIRYLTFRDYFTFLFLNCSHTQREFKYNFINQKKSFNDKIIICTCDCLHAESKIRKSIFFI